MAAKRKPITDEQLLRQCQMRADKASKFSDTTLKRERREVIDYMEGTLPAKTHEGQSSYVSLDVLNGVEAMKAQLLETFSAGSNIAAFQPLHALDEAGARVATDYVEHQFYRKNEGMEILADVIHNGLTARVGVAKFWWQPNPYDEEHSFEALPENQLYQALQDQSVSPGAIIAHQDELGQTLYSGSLTIRRDKGQVRIEVLPPEEFIVESRTKFLRKARYVAHRTIKTLGDLVSDGYDKAKVFAIKSDADELEMDEEAFRRRQDTDGNIWGKEDDPDLGEASREVTVYESYIRCDRLGRGTEQLWRVVHAGDTVLETQEVDRLPFKTFTPLPRPHTFWGANYAWFIIPIQKVKTVINRGILDATVRAVMPRLQVVKGGVTNPRELIDARPGGIVNVTRPDAILPVPQSPLPPQVFQVMDRADADREDVTGISRLSQGLSKDAVSQQNSANLVETLTTNSQVRQTVIAKFLAVQFVREAFLEVYQLVRENGTAEQILEVSGERIAVRPSEWPDRDDMAIDLELAYGARDRKVAELLGLHKTLSEDPKMGRLYDEAKAYQVLVQVLRTKGIKNPEAYINDPAKLGPAQPDPKMLAELEKLKTDVEVTKRKQDLAEQKAQHETQMATMAAGIDEQVKRLKMMLDEREADRMDSKVESENDVRVAELELAAAQFAAPDVERKVSAIISPS